MNEIPISHASYSEVQARVAYRCLAWFWTHTDSEHLIPPRVMEACSVWLRAEGFPELSFWVSAYGVAWRPMFTAKSTREDFINRARHGLSWRRVAYPAYKATRRNPPVSNTGVASGDHEEG